MVIKPRAGILPMVSHRWIVLFILSMSSVRQKEVNNGVTLKIKKSNKQNTVKPTMKVFTEITVSRYLLQHSLVRFPKFGKKIENRKHIRWSTKTCDKDKYLNYMQYSNIYLTKTMIWYLLYKTNFQFYSLWMFLSPLSSPQFLSH